MITMGALLTWHGTDNFLLQRNIIIPQQVNRTPKTISLILEKDVNGLAVTSNGVPCGIITRYDLLNRYAGDISTFD